MPLRYLSRARLALFLLALSLKLFVPMSGAAENGFLKIQNGYFWDPKTQDYFLPRGIAYQLWNPPVGANQSFDQLTYDLTEFKKNYINSVRCEMVWSELETAPGVYDWHKAEHLVSEAERLGLKLFVLIGFQYPPPWFPKEYRGINALGLTPDVMQCLASSAPADALQCFPDVTRQLLVTNIPPEFLANVRNLLVTGAKSGSITNVLGLLQSNLPPQLSTNVTKLLISDVINYENPDARAAYAAHLAAVTGHFKDRTAIGGWIMGNEYAYFDLWENPDMFPAHRFIGFDALSQAHFREYLKSHYADIATLNQTWRTTYSDFDAVVMPAQYPLNRDNPAYFDLIEWRKNSIGEFVAAGAAAARKTDPNHLQTYSMVGGIFSGRDANNACEDAKTIVARCRAANAPLDFWSINNYANASIGYEMRSADFGIGKYQEESGLPVMISETGHSSTEDLFDVPNAGLRQAKADPSQIWESLVSGVIGTHLFHWNDRSQYQQGYFLRERGFGIVEQNRVIKGEVYTNVMNMFRRMAEIRIDNLLGNSSNPPVNVQFFWSTNSDMVWPRANQENAMIWGALRRLGYQPGIIDDAAFESGAYSNAPVLLLSRCYQMNPQQLQEIATRVLPAGIHVHANADLPGQFDPYSRLNPNWNSLMSSVFGLATANAVRGFHGIVTNDAGGYQEISFQGARTLSPLDSSYRSTNTTWEIWHNLGITDGTTVVTDKGANDTQNKIPALVTKEHAAGWGKSAVNTFALGDSGVLTNLNPKEFGWDFRSQWLQAIYQTYFGVTPVIQLTGPGAAYVMPDYRLCRNGSILVSLLNEGTNSASVTLTAPSLLQGKTVENLTQGGIVARPSNGVLNLDMQGDDYILLYAFEEGSSRSSLIQSSPYRVWFESAPVIVHPRAASYPVSLGFDTQGGALPLALSFESAEGRVLSRSVPATVTGKDQKQLEISIPDADPSDPTYVSTPDGGSYFLHATLGGASGTESRVPVRLAWAVRPTNAPPATPLPGQTYTIPVEWQELPSLDPNDPTPFDRALLWDSIDVTNHAYAVILNLVGSQGTVASNQAVTRLGNGSANLGITVPLSAGGPLQWSAEVRPVTLQSHDVWESFEGRDRGAMWPSNLTTFYVAPWGGIKYPGPDIAGIDLWQNEGVQLTGSDGSQSAFLVLTNPPGLAVSLFGFAFPFSDAPWALPTNSQQWTNWFFSFDFREDHGYACDLQMQIKNDDPDGTGKWLQYGIPYNPGSNGWAHVAASLDQFQAPAGLSRVFEPDKVTQIVILAIMHKDSVQYVGSFDNIRFDGPDQVLAFGAPVGSYGSANDSAGFLKVELVPTNQVRISWTGNGNLESAEQVKGPWTAVFRALSPLEIPRPPGQRFYRLAR